MDSNYIGERIKYFRSLKGYSTNKLANMSGVSQSYLRSIELGNQNPSVSFLSLICESLEISLAEFFGNNQEYSMVQNELMAEIYKLNPSQRKALCSFLKTLN